MLYYIEKTVATLKFYFTFMLINIKAKELKSVKKLGKFAKFTFC